MVQSFTQLKRIRKSFGRLPEVAPMPNLIEVQKQSYDRFLEPVESNGTPLPSGLEAPDQQGPEGEPLRRTR